MTYLVTGGTGFIGAHILRLLLKNGDRVVAFDIAPDRMLLEQVVGKAGTTQVVLIAGDITDLKQITRACKENSVKKVIHTAAIIGSENPAVTVRVNCDGTVNVLEAARKLGLEKVVLASSIAVFGPPERYPEEYVPNDAPHFPMTIYGASKSFNEACARLYFTEHGLNVVAIRLPHVYGIGRTRGVGRLIDEELFIKPVALGKPGRVPFGNAVNNWLYIEDAARVLVMASRIDKTDSRAFTAGGDIRSTAEVAAYIKSQVPTASITLLPGRFNHPYKFETTPIRDELDYQPMWTMEQALDMIIHRLQNERS
jgi:nucleoside-diphosphate-sugar epimerase